MSPSLTWTAGNLSFPQSFIILSDLHLESPKAYDIFDIEPKAPYLALLGDIGNVEAHKADFLDFLTR
ncbi:hypothetical protein B0H63DRAFT_527469 [Podospora didyma]|uniref:Calcineurin-like phosphoesterase domain-containing protein n=1 Tax=Podospora didyma TaxID=330526 RepID=A0AAE0KAP3_9PEZI|nr:hypothetical protein B0H63DRAFT_527469 [Podospora didyma]